MKMSSKKQEKRDNVVHLKKRSSHINTVYDDIIGPAIDYFNPSKLPQCRPILQRYRCLRSQDINIPLCNISNVISEELQKVWDLTCVPYKSAKAVKRLVCPIKVLRLLKDLCAL